MKGNLARLVPAIERELRDAEVRRAHRRAEATIRHLAYHDPLTGLVNRHQFEQRLDEALRSALERGTHHALLYLDLDQFKVVNDTCGHVAGDELLKQMALMLRGKIREGDTLARLGGDEFGALLESCPLERARQIADHLLQSINDYRFTWTGMTFTVGGSFGLVPIDERNTTVEELLRNADVACYAAKDFGRNRIHVYHEDDLDLSRRRGEMQWVSRLNWALAAERLVLHQQRILPVNGGGKTGCCEILVRLIDEAGVLVPPGAFLPAAERYNVAPALDRWVVRTLLDYLARHRQTIAAGDRTYFVNLSGATLNDDGFFGFVRDALRDSGLPGSMFCFEITETAAIANLSRAVNFINGIRGEGCQFALDDFGSGLSSFSYLKAIPVDYLKIDGCFIRDIASDPMDRAIVEAINAIGHVVGLKTIAEFVENDAIHRELQRIGVDYSQGFCMHRPEPLAG
jgi:diguanylate cyclase (GGDEF)-like protein